MNQAAAARIQRYRDRARQCVELRNSTSKTYARELHDAAAQQWIILAEQAERIEQAYPDRPLNRAREPAITAP